LAEGIGMEAILSRGMSCAEVKAARPARTVKARIVFGLCIGWVVYWRRAERV